LNTKTFPAVKAAASLFWLNAAIWLIIGVVSLVRVGGSTTISKAIMLVIAVLMFANAAGMLWIGIGIARRRKLYFYLALGFLAINILLTFTDEFGILDLITLLIDIFLLGLLILSRSYYTQVRQR